MLKAATITDPKFLPPRWGKVRMGVKSQPQASYFQYIPLSALDGGVEPAPTRAGSGGENYQDDCNSTLSGFPLSRERRIWWSKNIRKIVSILSHIQIQLCDSHCYQQRFFPIPMLSPQLPFHPFRPFRKTHSSVLLRTCAPARAGSPSTCALHPA